MQMSAPAMGTPLPRRLLATFVAPRRLFEEFKEQSPWVGALIVSIIAGILAIVLLPDQVFYEGVQGATTRRGVPVEITSDAATIAFYERIRLSMGVVVVQPLVAVICAGFLALVFSTVLRGEATFRQYLAVTTHAFLISGLGALLLLPLQIARADAHLQLTPALLAGLGGWESGIALQQVNLFTVWMLIVLALGVSMLNRRHSWGAATAILLGVYFAVLTAVVTIAS